ncbi:hypothetical protein LUZ63_012951 [Rhynchospora breviuscula]|uniref:F-box domain-containing protein n=1 Tax=Rhynchospora breviuscula TaxID=2022672 RepID=A0A9Q0HJQ9_9POAL|nr:hypothetical protein LUZ63_012951 [Rhynchospora breviuscula]
MEIKEESKCKPQIETDRLSSLHESLLIVILSFLPTRHAVRTSVLSRRFQHLWKASPSVNLSFEKGTFKESTSYVAMANSVLLSRQPSDPPLLRLNLYVPSRLPDDIPPEFISSLLAHAHSLGLRHLSLDGFGDHELILHSVFSITSLQSLSLPITSRELIFPSEATATTLTRLKSLSVDLNPVKSAQVERLLSELCCLEHLRLGIVAGVLTVSSSTVKKLELLIIITMDIPGSVVRLCMPSLEFLYLESRGTSEHLPHIHGDVPLLRKSVITLRNLRSNNVNAAIAQFLKFISHVEELSLDLKEHWYEDYPFDILLEPGKEAPVFPNLKHLNARMCFHEHNFKAVISLLCQSPFLQSVKLVHKAAGYFNRWPKKRRRKDWRSKLLRNADGNYQYAYFTNLHLMENNRFMKLLSKNSTPLELKACKAVTRTSCAAKLISGF